MALIDYLCKGFLITDYLLDDLHNSSDGMMLALEFSLLLISTDAYFHALPLCSIPLQHFVPLFKLDFVFDIECFDLGPHLYHTLLAAFNVNVDL